MSLINKNNNGKGIVTQIQESRVDNTTYELLEQKIRKLLEDIMYGNPDSPNPKERKGMFKKLPEGFNLDDHIKDGFMYQTEGPVLIMTGAGGIRIMIEAARKLGLPDELIAQDIYVGDFDGSTGMQWIGDVIWTPINQE